jgi:hypothetical protein
MARRQPSDQFYKWEIEQIKARIHKVMNLEWKLSFSRKFESGGVDVMLSGSISAKFGGFERYTGTGATEDQFVKTFAFVGYQGCFPS